MCSNFTEIGESEHFLYPRRAAVIIDGGYWEQIRESMGNPDINLAQLSEDLCKPAYRLRTYYFDGKSEVRQHIHDQLLLNDRFEVVLGDVMKREMKCNHCGTEITQFAQKRVDMLIAVTLVHLASTKQVDLIVLIAGDRDFLPVVEVAKTEGVVIRLAYSRIPKANVASGLFQKADERIHLADYYLDKYIIGEKPDKIDKVGEVDQEEVLGEETIQEIELIVAEEMKKKRRIRIGAEIVGGTIKNREIPFKGKIKELETLTKGSIKVEQEKNQLFVTLSSETQKKLLPDFEPNKDPAVKFLLEVLKDVLEEENEKFVVHHILSTRMWNKKPNWKEEYEIQKKYGLKYLLDWASEFVDIKIEDGEKFIGLK